MIRLRLWRPERKRLGKFAKFLGIRVRLLESNKCLKERIREEFRGRRAENE